MRTLHDLIATTAAAALVAATAAPAAAQDAARTIVLRFHKQGDSTVAIRGGTVTIDHVMEVGNTDADGKVQVPDLDDGGHIVELVAKGYQAFFDNFTSGPRSPSPIQFDPANPEPVTGWWTNGKELMRLETNGAYQLWMTQDRFQRPVEVGAWRRSNYVYFELEPYRVKPGTRIKVQLIKEDGETKIEQSRHRRHGSTYVSAGLRNHFRRRLRRRPSSHLGDCRAGCDGLEASPRTALALPAVGHHVDVPDVACIA